MAIDELGGVPDPMSHSLQPGAWPSRYLEIPSTVRDLLEQMIDQVDIEKIVIQNMIENRDGRMRSYELLADEVGLSTGDS